MLAVVVMQARALSILLVYSSKEPISVIAVTALRDEGHRSTKVQTETRSGRGSANFWCTVAHQALH